MGGEPAGQTELLIEVGLPQDVANRIGGSEYAVATARPIEVVLRVSVHSGSTPPSITLTDLRLFSETALYENTFPSVSVQLEPSGHGEALIPLVVFPSTGLFWFECRVQAPGFSIQTLQRTLQGETGRGWFIRPHETAEVHATHWFTTRWRSPVIAVDVLALIQERLNRRMLYLTWVVIGLAILQIAIAALPWLFPLIGNTLDAGYL